MTANEDIQDGSIRHMVWLERYKTSTVRKIISLLNKADDDLRELIAARLVKIEERGYDIGPATTKRLNKLLDEIRAQRVSVASLLFEETRDLLSEFTVYEADFQARLVEGAVATAGAEISLERPAVSQLRGIATSQPFRGRLLKDWYEGLGEKQARDISDAVKIGMTEGQTTDQIVRRIIGTKARRYTDGILEISRRDTQAIVRTAISHVANRAAENVWQANADIIQGEKWISTLDGRTTAICRTRDGKVYPVGQGPRPPAHFGCRSKTVPFLGETITKGTRSGIAGPVPEDMTYERWLLGQTAAVQDEILGKAKGALFRRGGLPLDRFSDRAGREYTLEELKVRDREIWNRVF